MAAGLAFTWSGAGESARNAPWRAPAGPPEVSYRATYWCGDTTRNRGGELAEDLAQDALLTILEKLDTFRGESQFTTWAYAVALRGALGALRRKRWQERSAEAPEWRRQRPVWPLEDQRSHNPEQVAQQSELWQAIHRVIAQDLTVRQRTVLVGHVFQGVRWISWPSSLGRIAITSIRSFMMPEKN